MDTILSSTGSKYIAQKPMYRGDLINNVASYWPRPDYTQKEWKMAQANAEGFTYDGSRFNSFLKKRMVVCSMSGGYFGYRLAERNPDKILKGSKRFIQPDDSEYMTIQKLSGALGAQIVGDEVFAKNGAINQAGCEWMAQNTMRDHYIVGPDDREGHLRALHSIHSMMQGMPYEDAIFEMAVWGPEILLDHEGLVLWNAHAWSRNGANEKGIGLAGQYGAHLILEAREGKSFDVVDIMNRPVGLVDQAWEDFRHIVFEVEKGFRTETAAALLLSRFMHDEMWQADMPYIDKAHAHETVKAHYADDIEQERMAHLKAMAMPYLAERCNWPTLHSMLDEDAHHDDMNLKSYWEEYIEPSKPRLMAIPEIEQQTLSYLPRGGFEAAEIAKLVETRKDPADRRVSMAVASSKPRIKGLHHDPFDSKFDPKIFNDRNFSRLGSTSSPDKTPDNDHLTFEQAAAIMIVNAANKARRPAEGSKTFLYLDDASGGLMGASFEDQNNVTNSKSVSGMHDPLKDGGKTFAEAVANDHGQYMTAATYSLMNDENFADWRANNDLGNIVTLTDFKKAGAKYAGKRDLINDSMRLGIAADGPLQMTSAGIETCVRRFTALGADGIILNPGKTTALEARVIGEAVNVAMGQTARPHSGGKFEMDFFMFNDYLTDPLNRAAPVQLDLGDLILHLGMQVKANLESKNPDDMTEHNITLARLLEYYEMTIDPQRRNIEVVRDEKTGADHIGHIVDFGEVKPEFTLELLEYDPAAPLLEDLDVQNVGENQLLNTFLAQPEFEAFMTLESQKSDEYFAHYASDPARKARLVQMMWAYMCALPVYTQTQNDAQATQLPVTGMLKTKGMAGMDDFDLRDLDDTYKKGRDAMDGLNEKQIKNIYGSGELFIDGPSLTMA